MDVSLFIRDQIGSHLEKRIDAFEKGYRQNVGVIGPSGFGKTNLLASVFQSLIGRAQFVPVYVHAQHLDFEDLIDKWAGAMLTGVFLSRSVRPPENFHSLMRAASPIVPKTVQQIESLKKYVRKQKNAIAVKELFAVARVLSEETEKKVILMIDEFHLLEELPATDPFTILGREIMAEKNALYIVTSSLPARAREVFREKFSLLFGNFEVIPVGTLNFDQIYRFLHLRYPDKNWNPAQIRFLIRLTDGNPKYLNIVLDQLEVCLNKPLSEAIIPSYSEDSGNRIPTECLLESFYQELFENLGRISLIFQDRIQTYYRLVRNLSPYLKTLLALANGRRRILEISSYLERSRRETKKILERLIREEIINRKGDFYFIGDLLFSFWLREVYQPKMRLQTPDLNPARWSFYKTLEGLYEDYERAAQQTILDIVESLFRLFRNDVLEIEQKKWQCPQFSEILPGAPSGRMCSIQAKGGGSRWFCQATLEKISEEDVVLFLEESKKLKKKVGKRLLMALGGIDQNAKLMAQEARIQLWDLDLFNILLDAYGLPKMISWSEDYDKKSDVGALAQSIHSA